MVSLINIENVIHKKYIVPDFQRDYAWTEKNLELMLNDIKSACKNKKRYILGPIVISGQKVIDGQQRLTSLMIVLKALHFPNIDFLGFENREHVENLFRILSNSQMQISTTRTEEHPTCEKIRAMYQFACDYISKNFCDEDIQGCVNTTVFCDYLKHNVYFLEKQLNPGTEIQHAFEVLNTAGEQLKKEDIAKAKIIANMVDLKREKESELFNFSWLLCCDIENDLNEEIVKKAKEINDASSLDSLYKAMKDFVQNEQEGAKVVLSDIVYSVEKGKKYSRTKSGNITDFQTGEYAVCLIPYDFIDLALSSSMGKSIADIVKTDSIIKDSEQAYEVIKTLLLYRIAFDQYVVKRRKGNIEWFITKHPGDHNKRLIRLQSMLAVSGVESSKKLVSTVKTIMVEALSSDSEVNTGKLICELEKYAISRTGKELDNLDNGVRTNHFVFHWLDYLLYLNPPNVIKEKAELFSFIDTSSVEHFMPQHLLSGKEHSEEWEKELNKFGNLALITPSSNSKQSNLPPKEKATNHEGERIESLKYELMLHIAAASNWTVESSIKHGEEMKKLLSSYKNPQFNSLWN